MTAIALLGCGTVGSAFATLVAERDDLGLVMRAALVRDVSKLRPFVDADHVLTTDPAAVLSDPAIRVVVEAMGGLEPARQYVLEALDQGKAVVTANKQLVAHCGAELATRAARNAVPLYFDACVGSGLRAASFLFSLPQRSVRSIAGILNATTNFVLTQMEEGASEVDALAQAHELGITEPDCDDDTSGSDSAAKLSILATLAFGARVDPSALYYRGIDGIGPGDFSAARRIGMTIRLLAMARGRASTIEYFVGPCLVPLAHPFATVHGLRNLLLMDGDGFDQLAVAGPGAGGAATASTLLGDVLRAVQLPVLPVADLLAAETITVCRTQPRLLWLPPESPERRAAGGGHALPTIDGQVEQVRSGIRMGAAHQ